MTQTLRAAAPPDFPDTGTRRRALAQLGYGGVSLVAHLLLVWVLSFPSPPPAKKPANVIAATLVLRPPSATPAQQSASQKARRSSAKPDNEKNSPAKPQLTTTATTPDEEQPRESAVKVRSSRAEGAPPHDVSPKALLAQPHHEATTSVTTRINPRAALDAYMSATQQQAILGDGADTDEAFFSRSRSLDTSFSQSALPPQTADGPQPSRVNCSSGLNKTLAMLSGIAGGTLRCSEHPDLAPHLEKRLKAHTSKYHSDK